MLVCILLVSMLGGTAVNCPRSAQASWAKHSKLNPVFLSKCFDNKLLEMLAYSSDKESVYTIQRS